MAPKGLGSGGLASALPPGGLTLVSGCAAESALLSSEVMAAGAKLGAMTFCGIFVPGLNRLSYLACPEARILTFFMTPELRAARAQLKHLPLCYQDILAFLRRSKPTAALFMAAPPNAEGFCSFGVEVDFLAELWPDIPVRIAHINPAMPATRGDSGVPFDKLTAFYEEEQPLLTSPEPADDEVSRAIGEAVAAFVPDGATLQTGIGKVPGATLRALVKRRRLCMHSGLVGDAALDLIEAGAIALGGSAVVGAAIGSERLYRAAGEAPFEFRPVSVTHGVSAISSRAPFVTINSAIEVDLFGQVYAELTPGGLISGPGGASDYARAARATGAWTRIVALPASAGAGATFSRIVARGAGPVSLGRMDVDVVATEFGAADLREKDFEARALALVGVAHPAHREALTTAWKEIARTF